MRRLHRSAALVAGTLAIACIAVPAQPIASAASAAGTVKLRLTGLNRDSQVVAVPQASLLGLRNGAEYLYQGSPLAVRVGTYLIAAEVPAFSGTVQTSDTLVFAKETVGRAETIRLDGRGGRKLNVSLTGVSATPELLIADVCMSRYPGYGGSPVVPGWRRARRPAVTEGRDQLQVPRARSSGRQRRGSERARDRRAI